MQQPEQSRDTAENKQLTAEQVYACKWAEQMQQDGKHQFYRVDLSLKQRKATDLITVRTQEHAITVRVRPRRFSLKEAAVFAPYEFLSDEEVRRIAMRIANRMNRYIYGNRARKTRHRYRKRRLDQECRLIRTVPRTSHKVPALICQHDLGTRRHLHCLFGRPLTVSDDIFQVAIARSLRKEPFLYRHHCIASAKDLLASVIYNADPAKSSTSNPTIYVYPNPTGDL